MTNVHKLKRPSYVQKIESADDALNTLRLEMYSWNAKDLADEVGVSVACIYAIKSGRTKWPRPHTFFGLIEACGLTMLLVKQ